MIYTSLSQKKSILPRLGICEAEHIEDVDRDLTRRQFGIEEPLVLTAKEKKISTIKSFKIIN